MAAIDQTGNEAFDICWARADNDPKGFTIKNSAGAAINITGFSFVMTVNDNKNPTVTPPVGNEQFSVVGSIDDGPNGQVSFSPLTSETDIAPGTYWYDIQQTDGASKVKTLVKGKLLIIQDISK